MRIHRTENQQSFGLNIHGKTNILETAKKLGQEDLAMKTIQAFEESVGDEFTLWGYEFKPLSQPVLLRSSNNALVLELYRNGDKPFAGYQVLESPSIHPLQSEPLSIIKIGNKTLNEEEKQNTLYNMFMELITVKKIQKAAKSIQSSDSLPY